MVKKPTRLRFTEDDLADSRVKKAVNRADKAADKAEKAVEKVTPKKRRSKLRDESELIKTPSKLRFGKAEIDEIEKPSAGKKYATRLAMASATAKAHQSVSEYEDDNVGVQAVHQTEQTVETTIHAVDQAIYSHKLKAYNKAERLVEKSDKANVNALYEKHKKENPDTSSNPISRWQQKNAIKKEYTARKTGKDTVQSAATVKDKAKELITGAKNMMQNLLDFCVSHSKVILIILAIAVLIMTIAGLVASCTTMVQGFMDTVVTTSFTANDDEIVRVDDDYKAMESALRTEIENIESTHSGYDEYTYDLDEINHNPYELAAYLTVLFEDYTRSEVQDTLEEIFNQQYELTLTEEVEVRTRTELRTGTHTYTDPDTGETVRESYQYEVEVEYDYYILHVKLVNKGLAIVVGNAGLTEDEMERYSILLQTQGNKAYLFEDDIYAASGGEYTDYDIPGEALTDIKFAKMINVAERYLGYPYVWGGSSPSTSFDCSGFVSYVINNCGNGWSVGRLTANGLMGICDIIPRSEAKPGDLIFFQGTYATSGASHVGIYVGNGMMIHCGNPISYASTETTYWQQHFYCFGRIR